MSSSSKAAPAPTRQSLDGEFIPPLEYPDTWGKPWCVQLQSLQAWQMAGGNTDGQACQWRQSADTAPPPESRAESQQTPAKHGPKQRMAA